MVTMNFPTHLFLTFFPSGNSFSSYKSFCPIEDFPFSREKVARRTSKEGRIYPDINCDFDEHHESLIHKLNLFKKKHLISKYIFISFYFTLIFHLYIYLYCKIKKNIYIFCKIKKINIYLEIKCLSYLLISSSLF